MVTLTGTYKFKPYHARTLRDTSTWTRHPVRAPNPREALDQALRDHALGKVQWHEKAVANVQPQKMNDKVEKPKLLVAETVLDHWLAGTDPENLSVVFNAGRTKNRAGTYFGYTMRRDGPMAERGTARFSYDEKGFLYSYDMPIALRMKHKGKTFVLVNGDGSPSPATNAFMRQMRERLSEWSFAHPDRPLKRLIPHAFVPFSVLQSAQIRAKDVRVIATTPDRILKRKVPDKRDIKGWSWRYDHFLGECLFTAQDKTFVCGLDRNDKASKRMFYMCQIPVAKKRPKTVDEALEFLRPEGLSNRTKRQGEWFFVPVPASKTPDASDPNLLKGRRVPILSDKVEDMATLFENGVWERRPLAGGRERRHVASYLLLAHGAVYAKGTITDDEHSSLRLGPQWHKVVKNLAIEGWRYAPTGLGRGARVD
jgi:hypothetical protein